MCAVIRQAMGDRYRKGSGGHALTHRNTHSLCPESRSRSNSMPGLNAEYWPRIFTINVWICIWSKINSDLGDKAQLSLFCMCMCVVVLFECPAVCRRPLLLTFRFPLCREAIGKSCTCEPHTLTHGLSWAHAGTVELLKPTCVAEQTPDHLLPNDTVYSETKVLSLRELIIASHITVLFSPAVRTHTHAHTHAHTHTQIILTHQSQRDPVSNSLTRLQNLQTQQSPQAK